MMVRNRSWPLWLFVAISLLLNVVTPPLLEWLDFKSFDQQIQAAIGFAGILAGQACFVVLLAGLTKRTWLGAYLFALGLAGLGYAALVCGLTLVNEFAPEALATMALLPAFLLTAASPLYVIRQLFGWRLVMPGDDLPTRQPLRLADIFSLIAILAAALVLVRVPQVVSESEAGEFWLPVVITCAILLGSSLVILPLHARIALGDRPVRGKLVRLVPLAGLIVVICFGIVQIFFFSFDAGWSRRLEFLPFLLTFLGAAIAMFYLALWLLAASGMRLVRACETLAGRAATSDQPSLAMLQRLTWIRIGGAVAVTMATSIYLANLQQWRAVRDRENTRLIRRAEATGGVLGIKDRFPSNLRLGPKATNADLAAFADCNQLEYLYLVETQVTDEGLAALQYFPQLRFLQLEHLSISDDGLVHLRNLPNLESLQIVNCHITGSLLARLPNKQRLTTLDLSRTQFNDDASQRLAEFSQLQSLTLDHTPITDRSLPAIGQLRALVRLRLAGTQIRAERFPFLPELQYLDLADTKVDDAAAPALAKLRHLGFLSLRNTKISNASLASLADLKAMHRVDLSDNRIDDRAVRFIVGNRALVSIDLSGTQVIGSAFAQWRSASRAQDITLARAAVDDQGAAALVSLGEVDELSLAHTNITDASLTYLAQIAIKVLDIRGTQVTFEGLLASGLPRVRKLIVGPAQFTSAQHTQLEKQLGVKVTTRP